MTPSIASIPIASNPHRATARLATPGLWFTVLLVGVLLASFGLAARADDGARTP